jgi:Cu-Zn family superoxide dismutase
MSKGHRGAWVAAIVALGVLVGTGVATAGGASVAVASGRFIANPGFVPGPVAGTGVDDATNPALDAEGRVHLTVGVAQGARTNATLHVSGLPGGRTYGAHLHAADCSVAFGSGHYQHVAGPATPDNEVWLDVTTNASGRGSASTAVPFAVVAGMRSVVVHQLPTNPSTGGAGQRLACMPIVV